METVPERVESGPDPLALTGLDGAVADSAIAEPAPARVRLRRRARVSVPARADVLWLISIYLATRGLLLLAAYLNGVFAHDPFQNELANWDGFWYREIANHGYLNHVSHAQTTLGFFPLYPLAIWIAEPVVSAITGQGSIPSATFTGAAISTVGGAVATYYVYRLATAWWGKEIARRATVLFILFPGSVVFSMVYSEGILLPLATACLFALERRRWLQAGILAGLATAVGPTGLVLIPVCAISAGLELRRRGWRPDCLRRVAAAPLLSLTGAGAFALFLWLWTGTPWANYEAQHYGWSEKTDPFALVHLTTKLAGQVSLSHLNEPSINLNLVVGLIGAILLVTMLALVFFQRRQISAEAIVWTLGISFLALTSEYVPPNPRMLITAFPAILVVGRYVRGKWFAALCWANGILLVLLSVLTFVGTTLRP